MKRSIFALAAVFVAIAVISSCEKEKGPSPSVVDSKIIISEISGSDDFIELFNSGTEEESLSGFKLRRLRVKEGVEDEQTIWSGQDGVKLAPGAYMVLRYVEGKTDNKIYARNLQNKIPARKNMYIWLQDASGKELCFFQRGQKGIGWGQVNMQKSKNVDTDQAYSFSLVQGDWVCADPTPGKANAPRAGRIDQTMMTVVINEIDLRGNRIELYNFGNEKVSLAGFQLRWSRIKDNEGDNKTIWEAEDESIEPGQYLSINPDATLSSYTAKNIHIRLRDTGSYDCSGEYLSWDDFKRGTQGTGWTTVSLSSVTGSMGRVPDGTGDWYLISSSIGKTNGTSVGGGMVPDMNQD